MMSLVDLEIFIEDIFLVNFWINKVICFLPINGHWDKN